MSDNIGFKGRIETSYMDSEPWWAEEKKAPEGAPNVLYVVLDDTGYSQIGCFGSLVKTPNLDAIAADGLRYRDFHVNAMCSPTRASLLTGCNNHTIGLGYLSNYDLGFPAINGNIDPKYGYISETLLENGYSTFCVGKWHLCNQKSMTGAGPYNQWPLGRGFERFYGFLNAAASQFNPPLVQDNSFIDPPALPEDGYHLSADLIDHAISYIGAQKSVNGKKPFFCYLAFGAMHGPHHAPKEYMDMYKGAFDMGYDEYRELVFARQKAMGIIPEDTVLTERNKYVKPWDSLTDWEKKVYARFMEAFAGYMTYTDEQFGRLIAYLKKIGQYDNTLIVFVSDNGASGEGGPNGSVNEHYHLLSMAWPPLADEEGYNKIGTEDGMNNYPPGWAWAGNCPLKLYKSWVHAGGVKVPMIISYPNVIKAKGEIRTQYHHVIDINTTVLDLCGIRQPEYIRGVRQEKKPGISMRYSFDDADAPRQRHVQYYEMLGNRGIWEDGWKAVANHVDSPNFDSDEWELYNTDVDFSESNDLARQYPEKLNHLINLWWHEAGTYGVLPLLESHFRDRDGFDFNLMLRFAPAEYKSHVTVYRELGTSGQAPRLSNKSYTVSAKATYRAGDEGVLIGAGCNAGGYVLYIEDGKLKYHYNNLDETHFDLVSDCTVEEGEHEFAFDFVNTHPNKGIGHLLIDGKKVSGPLYVALFPLFSASGSLAIGRYATSVINPAHKGRGYYKYTNEIDRVDYELERPEDDMDLMLEMERELEQA
ncbi:MAG: arylsulfatase [Oscillospiraceae bacterium]|nr:arylsulfatase [Oscillospiraceae bacterium]